MTLLLEYYLAHFRNRRPRISPRPLTMASSQRTSGTLRIVTLKRTGISIVLFPRPVRRNLANKKPCIVNTENMSGWARLSGFKMWLSSRTFTNSRFLNLSTGQSFQAFLLYLYTNSIEFAPFGSEENRKSRSSEIAWTSEEQIPTPSPKSIYRLADKVPTLASSIFATANCFVQYEVPALKQIALAEIGHGLQKCDIVQETFSVFTSRCA